MGLDLSLMVGSKGGPDQTVFCYSAICLRARSHAMSFIHAIRGRHIQTIFLVDAVKGPGSSQNILSTAWC